MASKLFVSGASGQLGQRVMHHLLNTLKIDASRIVAGTRNPVNVQELTRKGVEVRAVDFNEPEGLENAFYDVDRLLIISTGDAGDRAIGHINAIKAAEAAGVQHVVYTSIPNPSDATLHIVRDHAATEKALADSHIEGFTILRNNWYFENLLFTVPDMLKTGNWYTAAGEGGIAWISRDDLALAAATALANDKNEKLTLTLSGTKTYTSAQLAELLQSRFNKPINVVNVSVEDVKNGMQQAGLPADVASLLSSADAHIAAGRLEGDANDFKNLTGKTPQNLTDWLKQQTFN